LCGQFRLTRLFGGLTLGHPGEPRLVYGDSGCLSLGDRGVFGRRAKSF
jgi:hypothetical protein